MRGEPYLGPCRRVRGLRSAAVRAVAAATDPRPVVAAAPDRLARALEGLRAAVAQQAGVMTAWRVSLVELERALASLQLGLVRQAGAMQALGAQASRLGTDQGSTELAHLQ